VVVLLYAFWGWYSNNRYGEYRVARSQYAAASRGPLRIGVMWNDDFDQSYRTAVEVGVAEVNARGGKFSDGTPIQLEPVYVDANRFSSLYEPDQLETANNFGEMLERKLLRDRSITSVLVRAAGQTEKSTVLCEAYGAALLHAGRSQLESNFIYPLAIQPGALDYIRRVNRTLDAILEASPSPPASGQTVNVGIYFDATVPNIDNTLHACLQDLDQLSSLTKAVRQLREGIAKGDIDPQLTLQQLDWSHYLQSGLSDNPGDVDTLQRLCVAGNLGPQTTLDQALSRALVHRRAPRPLFVRGFVPSLSSLTAPGLETYASLVVPEDEARQAELVVFLGPLVTAVPLMRELRRVQQPVPVVAYEYWTPAHLRLLLGPSATNLYLVSLMNPNSTEPEFLDFKTRFEAQATAEQRPSAIDADALLGYQSVLLLEQALLGADSRVPLNLVNALKFPPRPLQIMGSPFKFDLKGQAIDRPTYVLKFTGDGFELIEGRK